jgi:hypothetical protein
MLNSNLKSNLEGISVKKFQNLLINISECDSKSKHTDMIYKS